MTFETKREFDCPAVSICNSLQNARKSCWKGGTIQINDETMTQRCMAGIILLIARLSGIAQPPHEKKLAPRGEDSAGSCPEEQICKKDSEGKP